jgi:hypothetical protein
MDFQVHPIAVTRLAPTSLVVSALLKQLAVSFSKASFRREFSYREAGLVVLLAQRLAALPTRWVCSRAIELELPLAVHDTPLELFNL